MTRDVVFAFSFNQGLSSCSFFHVKPHTALHCVSMRTLMSRGWCKLGACWGSEEIPRCHLAAGLYDQMRLALIGTRCRSSGST